MRTTEFSTSAAAESDNRLLREFLTAILAAVDSQPAILCELRALFGHERRGAELARTADYLVAHLGLLIQDALTLDSDKRRRAEARRLYLEPQESYTLKELAAIWQLPLDDVRLMFYDAVAVSGDATEPYRFRVSRSEALEAGAMFQVFRPVEIERALATEFERVCSDQWRTVPMLVHLPRFVVQTLRAYTPMTTSVSLSACAERFIVEAVAENR